VQRAHLWKSLDDNAVNCQLCSHFCRIADCERGLCAVRENRNGSLYTLVYDRIAALNLDPVEKKPLFHFYPGTSTLSFGTMGCNLSCSFCQNSSLSMTPRESGDVRGQKISPEELVEAALSAGAASISYTYSEPTIFFEIMRETAALAQQKGLKNIMVSNGFMSPQCLDELKDLIDAANIDLKAFTEAFYQERCGAKLKPVLDNIIRIHEMGWWLELTTLVIPGLNDSREELSQIARFIAEDVSPEVPWHVSRFHPAYKLSDRGPTPAATLETAWKAGKDAGLHYVYVGNMPGHDGERSICPACGDVVMDRSGFRSTPKQLSAGSCSSCKAPIAGRGL
jgi:pyruvate formate lyase activating enzyme